MNHPHRVAQTLFPIDKRADYQPRPAERIEPMGVADHSMDHFIAGGAAIGLLAWLWAPSALCWPLTILGAVLLLAWLWRTA